MPHDTHTSSSSIVDVYNPQRVDRTPEDTITLLESSTGISQDEFLIMDIKLHLYTECKDNRPYSLITSHIATNKGSIEMIYDEGFRGHDSLKIAARLLIDNLGLSALILRSLISLRRGLADGDDDDDDDEHTIK